MLALPKEVKAWLDAALIEGNFSGYELLAEALKERGCAISKSSLQRYGEPFQVMMSKVKIAGEQAAALMAEAGDDKGAMNDALIRMIQQKTFEVLMSERIDQPAEGEEAVASIATDPKFVRALRGSGLDVVAHQVRAHETTGPMHVLYVATRRG